MESVLSVEKKLKEFGSNLVDFKKMKKRLAAFSGTFYPESATVLLSTVNDFIKGINPQIPKEKLRALIVPHAGYLYSGKVAAYGYAEAAKEASRFKNTIIIGLSHGTAFSGIGLSSADIWETPLGEILQSDTAKTLSEKSHFSYQDKAHEDEHSVEVQLPFLQTVLKKFKFTPLLTGIDLNPHKIKEIAQTLNDYLKPDTLLIVSTDLSHYLSYDTAVELDNMTINQILNLTPVRNHEQACGTDGINILIELASLNGWKSKLLKYANSGDVILDKDTVVGYTSIGFYK